MKSILKGLVDAYALLQANESLLVCVCVSDLIWYAWYVWCIKYLVVVFSLFAEVLWVSKNQKYSHVSVSSKYLVAIKVIDHPTLTVVPQWSNWQGTTTTIG